MRLKKRTKIKKQYTCQICARKINAKAILAHVKTEEYLLELIRKDHPRWQEKDALCKSCLDYYRRLIKEAEI